MGIRYTVGGKMKAILDPQVHPRGQLCGAPQGPVLHFETSQVYMYLGICGRGLW
jgi:hypothetical protein